MCAPIENALLDVRKAYRLLADYQQRVLELLGFIREELDARYYFQCFRNRPPRTLDGLEHRADSGKRLLPFNGISLLWLRNRGQEDPMHFHREGDLLIDVWVRSDTGNGQDEEPELTPEQSGSELRIYFFLCVEPRGESHNWYSKVWSNTAYPPLGKVAVCDNNPGYRAYGEALSLAALADEPSVHDTLTMLRQRASDHLGQVI